MIPGVGAIRYGDRSGDDCGGAEDFLEGGDGAVGDGDGLGGEGVAGAVGSEGKGVNPVLHGDIAEVLAIQERAAGGGVVDFDLHGAHAVDGIAVLVGEHALVVDFRGRGVGDGCKGEQRGGEECGYFHGGWSGWRVQFSGAVWSWMRVLRKPGWMVVLPDWARVVWKG